MSKQTKNLTILTVIMLVINMVLLGVIFFDGDEHHRRRRDRDHHRSKERFERSMSKRLDLDDKQEKAYEKLHRSHRKEFWELSKAIFETKKKIGESLALDQKVEAKALLTQLDSLHRVRERRYFEHTEAIFEIFTPDQRQQFLETLKKVGDEHRNKRRRRRN